MPEALLTGTMGHTLSTHAGGGKMRAHSKGGPQNACWGVHWGGGQKTECVLNVWPKIAKIWIVRV